MTQFKVAYKLDRPGLTSPIRLEVMMEITKYTCAGFFFVLVTLTQPYPLAYNVVVPIDRHDGGISIRRKGIPFVVHDGPVVVWQAEMIIDGVGELTEVFF